MHLYDKHKFIADLGISESTLKIWKKNGLHYVVDGNKHLFSYAEFKEWYLDYKRPLDVDVEGITYEEAQTKLSITREKKLHLEYLEKKRQLVSIDEVDKNNAEIASLFINSLRQLLIKLPDRILQSMLKITRLPRPIQTKIKEAITDIIDTQAEKIINKLRNEAEKKFNG